MPVKTMPKISRATQLSYAIILALLTSGSVAAKTTQYSALQLQPIANMAEARAAHQATLLSNGDVLITGGCSNRCDTPAATTALYQLVTQRFITLDATALPRDSHSAQLLADNSVLVAGGWSNGQITAQAERYQSQQGFSLVASMNKPRAAAASAKLHDGRVLITGGQTTAFQPLATAEWYDPVTARFRSASDMQTPRIGLTATTLQDGRVLIAGGRPGRRDKALNTAELFDPHTNSFSPTGKMTAARQKHAAVLLPDGKVLLLGGSDGNDHNTLNSTEWFDPKTGLFSPGPTMLKPRFKIPDAVVVMPDGGVLVAGGAKHIEYLNPQSGRFELLSPALALAPEFATATLLTDGTVLLLGGYDAQINTTARAWLIRQPYR